MPTMDTRSLPVVVFLALLILFAGCVSTAPLSGNTTISPHPLVTPSPEKSPEDLVTFVSDSVVYSQRTGKSAALREFSDRNGSFTRGDLYVWALSLIHISETTRPY